IMQEEVNQTGEEALEVEDLILVVVKAQSYALIVAKPTISLIIAGRNMAIHLICNICKLVAM
ncbi:hypothetical protein A2U01_0060890, partial [Trifolium medium]|nr:hypothetical protein [Trifolium medium]